MALPTASDNPFPSFLVTEGTVPSTPAAGKQRVYINSTSHRVKLVNSSGVESDLPGAELDYVEFTSNVNLTATTEATANTVVTSSAVTYDGTGIYLITFYCPADFTPAGAALTTSYWLYEKVGAGAAASIGKIGEVVNPSGSNAIEVPMHVSRRRTPSAASIIYSIRGSTSSGTSIAAAGAGGSGNAMPGFIRITKV